MTGPTRHRLAAARGRPDDRPVPASGVKLYAWVLNAIVAQDLSDTSNGYRAFRIEVLDDVVPLLIQDQYKRRGGDHRGQPGMADHRTADGVAPEGLRGVEKGGNLVFGYNYARVIGTTFYRVKLSPAARR